MSVLSRVNLNSQQRVDLSTFLAMDSFSAFDMRSLINSFVNDKAYIIRGFEVSGATGLSISVVTSNAFVFNPLDQSSSMFYGIPGTADTLLNLDPNQPNIYLEASFTTISQAPVTTGFWNPLSASSSNAAGSEFSASQNSQVIVQVDISANTVQFSENAIPLAIISTSASTITDIIDARPLLFRLGSGGSNPNPFNRFNWSPNRSEPQFNGTAVGQSTGSPYISSDVNGVTNDKGITSFKQALDAIMTRIAEIAGSPLWYTNSLAQQYVSNLSLNIAYLDSPAGHSIQPNKTSAFRFKKGQLPIVSVSENEWVNATNSTLVWIYVSSTANLSVGNQVTITGFSDSVNNGTFTIVANPVGTAPGVITINNPLRINNTYDEVVAASLTGFYYSFDILGTTPVEWRTNYQSIDWSLGGTYIDVNHRSYASTNLSVNVPDGSNVYLHLQRETNIGSGNAVKWKDNSSYPAFNAMSAVSGLAGDFTGIAIGDYVRKISEGISRYYQVSGLSDGISQFTTELGDDDKIADLTIVALRLSQPIIGTPSTEELIYWRKRYSAVDVFVDPYQIHAYSDANYYWLGRKNGDLFILRDFGLLQSNESAFTDDNNFSTVTGGGGDAEAIILEHGFGASLVSGNYQSTVVSPTQPLLTIRRRRSDNTTQDAYQDNSDSLLKYTLPAASIIAMTPGQSLYTRLSETTSAALTVGSVVSLSDDTALTDLITNVFQVINPISVPLKTFDNRHIFQIARCVTLEDGNNGLIFVDGTVLSFGGFHINNNLFVAGSAVITNGLNTYKFYRNGTVAPLLAGQTVQLTSVVDSVQEASAISQATSDGLVGVVYQNIAPGSLGLVQVTGDATVLVDSNLTIGKPAYLSINYGNVSSTVPTASGQSIYVVGQALNINRVVLGMYFKFLVQNIYEEKIEVVVSLPGTNQIIGPTLPGATLNLPLDSRDGFNTQFYVVGSGQLQVRLNGVWQDRLYDWNEVGALHSLSNQIQMTFALVVGDFLEFRIELEQNETIVGTGGGGGGGSVDLQGAYANGRTINTSSGNPVVISGPSGKLLHVAGDIACDGVVDPTAITFTPQGSSPIPGLHGLYTDSAGDLIYVAAVSSPVNISQLSSGGGSNTVSNSDTYTNNSGFSITGSSPVSQTATGGIKLSDPSDENSVFSLVGLLLATTSNNADGTVYTGGRMPCGIFSFSIGDALWLNVGGGLTNVKPSVGVNGLVSGMFIVQVGTVVKNKTNPSAKDILVRISINGQL